ncbi:hypothetical protein ACUS6C_04245 [Pseudomonas aeruginosa]
MIQLPYIALPRRDESLASVALRLAYGNGYECFAHFANELKLGEGEINAHQWIGSKLFKLITLQRSLLDHDRKTLQSIFLKRTLDEHEYKFSFGGSLIPSYFLRQSLALCPECVREGYLEHMHAYHFCDKCPKHSQLYIETCPSCGFNFELRKIKNFTCSCGKDLRKLKSHPADIESTKTLTNALQHQDAAYFGKLVAALLATKFLSLKTSRHETLEACQNIATASKIVFFDFIKRQQYSSPNLHRRALLVPWLLSKDPQLKKYAAEYYCAASQSRPDISNCTTPCNCSSLLFTTHELRMIFKCNNPELEDLVPTYKSKLGVKPPLTVPNLCKRLIHNSRISWEDTDITPIVCDRNTLLTPMEAANYLRTSRGLILDLRYCGLLQGNILNQAEGFLFSKDAIENFNNNYILNNAISRNLMIEPRTIHRLLTAAGIKEIRVTPALSHQIILYKKSTLPSELLTYLSTPQHQNRLPSTSISPNFATTKEVSQLLKIGHENIPSLVELGILRKTPETLSTGRNRRLTIDRSCLTDAINWRKNLLTTTEAAAHIGCTARLLHSRFTSSGYISLIHLKKISLLSYADAERAKQHFEIYITAESARSKYKLNNRTLRKWLSKGFLKPIPEDHKDFLRGQTTFPKEQFLLPMKKMFLL